MKKIIIFISLFFIVSVVCSNNVLAEKVFNDSKVSSFSTTSKLTTDIYGMEYANTIGVAETNGNKTNQHLSVLSMKTDGVTSKLVTWAIQEYKDGYARNKLSNIAADYEKNHPGWIVAGGINADQYYTKYGGGRGEDGSFYYYPQPYYPLIIDGERRFPINPYNASSNFIGFTNDGGKDGFIENSEIDGFYLYIYDESNVPIFEYKIEGFNKPATSGVSVWTTYNGTESNNAVSVKVTSDSVYLIESATLAHMNNSTVYGGIDSFFGRGSITSITDQPVLSKYQFAIDTKSEDIKSKLSTGTKVVVQAKYKDAALNKVESGAGYHSPQRINGIDITDPGYVNNGYNSRQYNRSIFGQKADGTYVLMTAEKKGSAATGYSGLNFTESNAALKMFGVVDAYQDDGGGSVTAIVRNKYGSFDVVNESSDSGTKERSILNGLFFVVRDPGFAILATDVTRNSVSVIRKATEFSDLVSNISVSCNELKATFADNKYTINDLPEDTELTIKIEYDFVINKKTYHNIIYFQTKTKSFEMPNPGLKVLDIYDTKIVVIKEDYTTSSWIKDVVVHVGDETYSMNDLSSFEITGLYKDTEYKVFFEYNVLDPETNNIYKGITEEVLIKTLSFTAPSISQFEESRVNNEEYSFRYRYKDDDSVCSKAYLLVNKDQYLIDATSGTLTVSLDRYQTSYDIYLVLEYVVNGDLKQIKSDVIHYEILQREEKKGCKKSINGVFFSSIAILSLAIYLFRKTK